VFLVDVVTFLLNLISTEDIYTYIKSER